MERRMRFGRWLARTIAAVMILIAAVCPLLSCAAQQEADASETMPLIRNIIMSFGDDEKDPDTAELLKELEEKDPAQGELWNRIIDYWHYANEEMEIHEGSLPDDLPDDDSLCIVVLGFELNDDGTMQDELIGRLTTALHCASQYPRAYVICTGGGTARNNPDVTEAELMGEWLTEHGLSGDRLIIENASRTTAQNALFSYNILLAQYPQVQSVVLISSQYHIPWGALLFESVFMKTASEQQTPDIHVISNCAYPCFNEKYKDVPRFETGGMLQMIGEDDLAMDYYRGVFVKPEL